MSGGGRREISAPNRERDIEVAGDRSWVLEREGEGLAAATRRSATIETEMKGDAARMERSSPF